MSDSADFHAAIHALEAKLLWAWVSGPSFRQRWTPRLEDFRGIGHQAIAKACSALAALGTVGDLWLPLLERLASTGDLARHWQLGRTPLESVQVSDPDGDLRRWQELSCLFALRTSLQEQLSAWTPSQDLSAARGAVLEASSKAYVSGPSKSYSLQDGFALAYQSMTRRDHAGSFAGYPELDRATGGIRPGHVWVLGAPTNWGKSSWLISVADHQIATHNKGVLIVSCEDESTMLFTRWLVRRAEVRGKAARDARLAAHELARVDEQMKWAALRGKSPVMVDGRGCVVERLAQDIRSHVAAHGIHLVLVDYLQCISTSRKTQDRRAEINHISRTLTDAIKTSGAAGILASQLTGEEVRESRDIEHAAEVVIIGRKSEQGEMTLFLKKNKTGPKDFSIPLSWNGETGSFVTEKDDDFDIPYSND